MWLFAKRASDLLGRAPCHIKIPNAIFEGREHLANAGAKQLNCLLLHQKMRGVPFTVIPFRKPFLIPVPDTRYGVVQFTHMYEYNPLKASEITAATIEGRRQMNEAFGLLKKHDPDFCDLELIGSSGVLGVRESRRIIGEYYLTDEDIFGGRHFDDDVTEVCFGVDTHPKNGRAQVCYKAQPFGIPFRCLIPRGVDGLLVAGRCISGSHLAMAAYRVTGDCCAMGEAAGKAAAYIKRHGGAFRDLDAETVREHVSVPVKPVVS